MSISHLPSQTLFFTLLQVVRSFGNKNAVLTQRDPNRVINKGHNVENYNDNDVSVLTLLLSYEFLPLTLPYFTLSFLSRSSTPRISSPPSIFSSVPTSTSPPTPGNATSVVKTSCYVTTRPRTVSVVPRRTTIAVHLVEEVTRTTSTLLQSTLREYHFSFLLLCLLESLFLILFHLFSSPTATGKLLQLNGEPRQLVLTTTLTTLLPAQLIGTVVTKVTSLVLPVGLTSTEGTTSTTPTTTM